MKRIIFLTATLAATSIFSACGDATNVNVTRNTNGNSNTAVLKTATPAPTIDRTNSNVSREDYDKNRAEYEKDRGSSTIGTGVNDSWLWFKTRAALLGTADLRESTINVDVVDEVITLKGTVADAAQKAKAEQVANGIEGKKKVVNELKVAPKDSMTNMNTGTSNSNANTKK